MILTLKELADHLKVNDRTILRMLKSGQIQGAKIGGQWRFNGSQIDSLFSPFKKATEDEVPLSELTRSNFQVPISRLINENRFIFDMKAKTVEEAITELTDNKIFSTLVLDIPDLRARCMARENLLSTAVGKGIAIPHPRDPIPSMKAPGIVVFGRSAAGINYNAPDGKKVNLFFLIVSQTIELHLYLMGRIANLLKENSFVTLCKKSKKPEEIIQAIMLRERNEFFA